MDTIQMTAPPVTSGFASTVFGGAAGDRARRTADHRTAPSGWTCFLRGSIHGIGECGSILDNRLAPRRSHFRAVLTIRALLGVSVCGSPSEWGALAFAALAQPAQYQRGRVTWWGGVPAKRPTGAWGVARFGRGLTWGRFVGDHLACGLAGLSPLALRRLFVVAVTLHVARQPLSLTKSLEAFQHLLNRLITSGSDLDQRSHTPFNRPTRPLARRVGDGNPQSYGKSSASASLDFVCTAGRRRPAGGHVR